MALSEAKNQNHDLNKWAPPWFDSEPEGGVRSKVSSACDFVLPQGEVAFLIARTLPRDRAAIRMHFQAENGLLEATISFQGCAGIFSIDLPVQVGKVALGS
jgi:hypothetical protein